LDNARRFGQSLIPKRVMSNVRIKNMNKKTVINILEKQKIHIDFRDGNIFASPPKMHIAIEFAFHEKVGRERLLKEIIICSPMKKSDLHKLVKELKSDFNVPIYNCELKALS
jgi:hypothetical protein